MFSSNVDTAAVTNIGIKYISSVITDPIDGASSKGKAFTAGVEGKSAVQGDVNRIKVEDSNTYYAVAFIEALNGKTYWSAPISCTLDNERKLAGYTEGGNN